MTGRVLPLHGSEHTAVDALLPWYVNGTLRGEELARVKEHLTACDQCRREVDWLRDVFAACAAIAPIPDAPPLADIHGIPAFGAPTQPLHGRDRISAGWRSTQPARKYGGLAAQFSLRVPPPMAVTWSLNRSKCSVTTILK